MVAKQGHHQAGFAAAELAVGPSIANLIAYFETCRRKRNLLDYDAANIVSDTEAAEILEKAREFKQEVEDWIAKNHPGLAVAGRLVFVLVVTMRIVGDPHLRRGLPVQTGAAGARGEGPDPFVSAATGVAPSRPRAALASSPRPGGRRPPAGSPRGTARRHPAVRPAGPAARGSTRPGPPVPISPETGPPAPGGALDLLPCRSSRGLPDPASSAYQPPVPRFHVRRQAGRVLQRVGGRQAVIQPPRHRPRPFDGRHARIPRPDLLEIRAAPKRERTIELSLTVVLGCGGRCLRDPLSSP